MINNIKFSIIVISLNTKLDFLKTINSILKQTVKNYEIIVIDGDSKDGTKEEIFKIKNTLSKFLIEKDKGIYDAMNKGIKISSGEWIVLLNSGDVFYNDKVLEKLSSLNLDDKEIVFGEPLVTNEELSYIVYSKKFDDETILMPFCHQSCIVRSHILKKEKFSLNYKFSSDFNFFLECFVSKIKFFKSDIIVSKVKAGGVSDKLRQDVFNENIDIIKKNTKTKHFYKLYYLKINQYLKDIFKFLLHNKSIIFFLKLKYSKRLVVDK